MKNYIKRLVKRTPLYDLRSDFLYRLGKSRTMQAWERSGKPLPPPQYYKHQVIKAYSKQYGTPVFVETGTFHGDTVFSCRKYFRQLFSIELDDALYRAAQQRFAKIPAVTILHGDSGAVINTLLNKIDQKCLFWLDGHYSEGVTAKGELNTPILAELRSIMSHAVKGHVILIDDARCFRGEDDYPTIAQVRTLVNDCNPNLKFSVEHDIIRINP